VAIYVIAGLLVVLFLFGAYRMMGAGASTEEDPSAVLAAVLETTTEAARALDNPPVSNDDDNEPHAVRRRLDGCAQALERIAAIPIDAALDQVRTSLELAVDELSWSARMAEAPGYARDDSLRAAGTALRTRGAANIAQARSLLEASARS
jgi:hypothetical protein